MSEIIDFPKVNQREFDRDMAINALHSALDLIEDVIQKQGKEAIAKEILSLEYSKNRLEMLYEKVRK